VNDLLLWRALGEREPLAEDLVPLLEELATRPPTARMPFVGRLIRAARDERPRVRAAALAGLSGHGGPEALRAVVSGLDDPVSAVAQVAVEALRSIGEADPRRLVHAVFHPDPAIRRAAVSGGLPPAAKPLLPHLLADEACVPDVLPQLADGLPGFALPAVLDGFATGRFSAGVAAELIARIAPAEIAERIAAEARVDAARATGGGGPWLPRRFGELLGALGSDPIRPAAPFTPTADRLPEVIRLLAAARDERPARGHPGDSLIDALVRSLHDVTDVETRQSFALAAAVCLLSRRTEMPPATAATHATNRPPTTPPGLRGPNSWLGWGRSFRSSARGVVAISG